MIEHDIVKTATAWTFGYQ